MYSFSAMRHTCPLVLLAVVVSACGGPDVVARAGPHDLTVERYAQFVADWQDLPLDTEILERWAHRWVEWALLADRIAEGDSLNDSTLVLATMWPRVFREVTERYRDSLMVRRRVADSAAVDSAFAAGTLRIIDQILIAPRSPEDRARARRDAEQMRAALARGASWAAANRRNDDAASRVNGGRLGVVRPGQLFQPLDSVAFGLAPGEISDVVASRFGFHVLRRPPLPEVRGEFAEAAREALIARFDSLYALELKERWNIRLRSDAVALGREALRRPAALIADDRVLGTFRGGEFTMSEFLRWLRISTPFEHMDLMEGDEATWTAALEELMVREAMFREARAEGFDITPDVFTELAFRVRRDVGLVRDNLRLDQTLRQAARPEERRAAVNSILDDYLADLAQQRRPAFYVPTFLSDELRSRARWRVFPAALPAVIERAQELREQASNGTTGAVP